MMRYYDHRSGEMRIKQRYKWACAGFAMGVACGVAIHFIF